MTTYEEIQKAGASARAIGKTYLDNPYLRSEACPANTGETAAEWVAKVEAWDAGWKIEHAMRPEHTLSIMHTRIGI